MRRDSLATVGTLAGALVLAALVGLTISLAFRSHDSTPTASRRAPVPAPRSAAPHTYAVAGLGGLNHAPPVTPLPERRRASAPQHVHHAAVRRYATTRRHAPAPRRLPTPARIIAARPVPAPAPAPVQVAATPAPAPVASRVVAVPQSRPAPAPKPRPAAPAIVFDDSG